MIRITATAVALLLALGHEAATEAAQSAVARKRTRAIMTDPQRNMLEVDCIIWSAALTTLAFIS